MFSISIFVFFKIWPANQNSYFCIIFVLFDYYLMPVLLLFWKYFWIWPHLGNHGISCFWVLKEGISIEMTPGEILSFLFCSLLIALFLSFHCQAIILFPKTNLKSYVLIFIDWPGLRILALRIYTLFSVVQQ